MAARGHLAAWCNPKRAPDLNQALEEFHRSLQIIQEFFAADDRFQEHCVDWGRVDGDGRTAIYYLQRRAIRLRSIMYQINNHKQTLLFDLKVAEVLQRMSTLCRSAATASRFSLARQLLARTTTGSGVCLLPPRTAKGGLPFAAALSPMRGSNWIRRQRGGKMQTPDPVGWRSLLIQQFLSTANNNLKSVCFKSIGTHPIVETSGSRNRNGLNGVSTDQDEISPPLLSDQDEVSNPPASEHDDDSPQLSCEQDDVSTSIGSEQDEAFASLGSVHDQHHGHDLMSEISSASDSVADSIDDEALISDLDDGHQDDFSTQHDAQPSAERDGAGSSPTPPHNIEPGSGDKSKSVDAFATSFRGIAAEICAASSRCQIADILHEQSVPRVEELIRFISDRLLNGAPPSSEHHGSTIGASAFVQLRADGLRGDISPLTLEEQEKLNKSLVLLGKNVQSSMEITKQTASHDSNERIQVACKRIDKNLKEKNILGEHEFALTPFAGATKGNSSPKADGDSPQGSSANLSWLWIVLGVVALIIVLRCSVRP